jgi:hypothetical protein
VKGLTEAYCQATNKQVMTIAIDLSGREVSSLEEVEVLVLVPDGISEPSI